MAALPHAHSSARRSLTNRVDAADVRISLGLAPEELRGPIAGMFATLELTDDDFTHRRYVLFADRGAEILDGACNYRGSANGDLRVIEDGGSRSRFLRRRQWRALGQLGRGVLRDQDIFELLVVAVRSAKAGKA